MSEVGENEAGGVPEIITAHVGREGELPPILHEVQRARSRWSRIGDTDCQSTQPFPRRSAWRGEILSRFHRAPVKAVQVGGPLGAYIPPKQFDQRFANEDFAQADALIGHASMVVFDESADMGQMARFAMEFCAAESCGKCTPCRIGSTRGAELIDRIRSGGRVFDHGWRCNVLGSAGNSRGDRDACDQGSYVGKRFGAMAE